MIKYFAVENYKSIKNKAILEFDSNLAEDYPYPASAVIGFAGANASGSTLD
jgi:AAA15 family ATPase/GTPase